MAARSETDDRAAQEATDWLIRLREQPDDPALRARFDAWLGASPAHRAAWAETARVYDLIGQAARSPAAPVAGFPSAPHRGARPRPAGAARFRRVAAGVAAAAIAACLAWVFLPGLMLRMTADYATAAGEQREIRLADGTTVELGPDSAIDVAYADGERQVRLLAGRAFFEVTHDPARQFRVEAHGVRATVLGTGFDMRRDADGAAVGVRHGVVRVDYPGAAPPVSRRLQAGDWVRVAWDGRTTAGAEPPDQIAAWLNGQLIARDRPVAEVVDELRAYYDGVIVLTSDTLGRRRVTGVYDLRDPVEALRALARAHQGVAVHRISPWLLVVSGG